LKSIYGGNSLASKTRFSVNLRAGELLAAAIKSPLGSIAMLLISASASGSAIFLKVSPSSCVTERLPLFEIAIAPVPCVTGNIVPDIPRFFQVNPLSELTRLGPPVR
jgi:hypothetical protein